MSDLSDDLKKLKFDKRMTKWNMREKLLTADEYEKHLKELKDVSDLKSDEPMFINEMEEETSTSEEESSDD